jgi:hypothetical protein
LNDLLVVDRHRSILGKERHRSRSASAFFENLDRLTPHLALSVIDLSKIKHLTLHNLATADAPVFHKIPIAILFAILLSRGAAQKHPDKPLFTENLF